MYSVTQMVEVGKAEGIADALVVIRRFQSEIPTDGVFSGMTVRDIVEEIANRISNLKINPVVETI